MTRRTGSARWTGDLMTGTGSVTVGEDAWTGRYSGSSRFHDVLPGFTPEQGTNPEELLAAAHAACFTMALSLVLTQADSPPPRALGTRATVHLRFADGAPRIERIDLVTAADVPGLDEARLRECAEEARQTCIISRALGGVAEVGVTATLIEPGTAAVAESAGTGGGHA